VLWHKSDQFYIAVYVNNLTSYGPLGHLNGPPVLAGETEFEDTNMGQVQLLLGNHITFNRDSIEVSEDAFVDKILEPFPMNDSDLMVLPINPNTRLTQESVLEPEDHHH
jgi:hypothetical protein